MTDPFTMELATRPNMKWHIAHYNSLFRRIGYRETFCGMAMYATEKKSVNDDNIVSMDDVCKTCKRVLKAFTY